MNDLSYIHGASNQPLLGEPIFQNLRRTAQKVKDRESVVSAQQGYRATYGELVEQCEEVARGLMDGHARHCMQGKGEAPSEPEAQVDELMGAVGRLMRRG